MADDGSSNRALGSGWVAKPPRLRTACTECHAAKVRCSGERAGCQRCLGLGLTCEYTVSMVGRISKHGRRSGSNAQQRRQAAAAAAAAGSYHASVGGVRAETAHPRPSVVPPPRVHTPPVQQQQQQQVGVCHMSPGAASNDMFRLPGGLTSSLLATDSFLDGSLFDELESGGYFDTNTETCNSVASSTYNMAEFEINQFPLPMPTTLPMAPTPPTSQAAAPASPLPPPPPTLQRLPQPLQTSQGSPDSTSQALQCHSLQCTAPPSIRRSRSASTQASSAMTAGQFQFPDTPHSQQLGLDPQTLEEGLKLPFGHVVALCKMIYLLETSLRSEDSVALDEIMQLNKACINDVFHITRNATYMRCKSCPMLVSTIMELVVTLYEQALHQQQQQQQQQAEQQQGQDAAASDLGSGGSRPRSPGSQGTSSDRGGSGGGGNSFSLPSLNFGVFQLDPEEQAALRNRIVRAEVQKCLQSLQALRQSLPPTGNNAASASSLNYADMEARIRRLDPLLPIT